METELGAVSVCIGKLIVVRVLVGFTAELAWVLEEFEQSPSFGGGWTDGGWVWVGRCGASKYIEVGARRQGKEGRWRENDGRRVGACGARVGEWTV
jgi:hypothetical protein